MLLLPVDQFERFNENYIGASCDDLGLKSAAVVVLAANDCEGQYQHTCKVLRSYWNLIQLLELQCKFIEDYPEMTDSLSYHVFAYHYAQQNVGHLRINLHSESSYWQYQTPLSTIPAEAALRLSDISQRYTQLKPEMKFFPVNSDGINGALVTIGDALSKALQEDGVADAEQLSANLLLVVRKACHNIDLDQSPNVQHGSSTGTSSSNRYLAAV